MLGPVWPLDQLMLHPEHTLEAVSTTLSPLHSAVEPWESTNGANGVVPVVTTIGLDALLWPQALLTEAV